MNAINHRRNPGSIAEMLEMLAQRMAENGPKRPANDLSSDPYDELLGYGTDADDRADMEDDIDPEYYSEERILERVEATVERRGLQKIG